MESGIKALRINPGTYDTGLRLPTQVSTEYVSNHNLDKEAPVCSGSNKNGWSDKSHPAERGD